MISIKILALDQARNGAWSVFDSANKTLLSHGVWSFSAKKFEFSKAVFIISRVVKDLIETNGIDVVFLEDTQLRQNAQSFKKLAQLQGTLINLCEELGVPYVNVPPTKWQNFCGARGRSVKEQKSGAAQPAQPSTKALSMQFARTNFGVETENDNLADAICIGHYAVNHLE